METTMFEKAVRGKLRFATPQGTLTVEDLWDLPLTSVRAGTANLNNIAKGIARELKNAEEEDFVSPKSGADEALRMKLEIVKRVIEVRQAENEAVRAAADRAEKKERIKELIAKKQDEALGSKSLEELQAMVADL